MFIPAFIKFIGFSTIPNWWFIGFPWPIHSMKHHSPRDDSSPASRRPAHPSCRPPTKAYRWPGWWCVLLDRSNQNPGEPPGFGFTSGSLQKPLETKIGWHMGMDQYLLIPFLVGWTSIYQLFWCSPGVQGFDTLPYMIDSLFPKVIWCAL